MSRSSDRLERVASLANQNYTGRKRGLELGKKKKRLTRLEAGGEESSQGVLCRCAYVWAAEEGFPRIVRDEEKKITTRSAEETSHSQHYAQRSLWNFPNIHREEAKKCEWCSDAPGATAE